MSYFRHIRNVLIIAVLLTAVPALSAQGHFEIGVHYSGWSLNILKGWIENTLSEETGSFLEDEFLEDIQADYPGVMSLSYSQVVEFDSSGSNFGAEIRWYPGGTNGSFSFGLAVEKTTMKIGLPQVSSDLQLTNGGQFEAQANGQFIYKPLSFHLNLRWDIIPSSPIHPFINFGFGVAGIGDLKKAELTYSYSGTYTILNQVVDQYSDSDTKTVEEIDEEREEGEDEILSEIPVVPFLQLTIGLKARFTENLYIISEAGIFNGFILRGGLALRF